ncbi:MAG: flagellar protein FlbD [Calditrichaeota bacterium]|nr:flagellar protein FlbD [Calditrichota bacterium]
MIEVTQLDGRRVVINGDQVERIEALPDTIISLTSGRKVIVRETVGELLQALVKSRTDRLFGAAPMIGQAMLARSALADTLNIG